MGDAFGCCDFSCLLRSSWVYVLLVLVAWLGVVVLLFVVFLYVDYV